MNPEQLDELERKAKAVQDAIAMNRPLRCVFDEYVEANSPDVTLHLVAVYRAALALDERAASMMPLEPSDPCLLRVREALRGRP